MKHYSPARLLVLTTLLIAPLPKLSAQQTTNALKMDTIATRTCWPQFLTAFSHFPELGQTAIRVRIKHSRSPLSTRPAWSTIFRRSSKRIYIITISDSTIKHLTPILFKNLDYNAQVGVLGHELSHVSDFRRMHFFGLMRVGVGHLSGRYVDRFEFKTDSICIAHGLGTYLLAWSIFVRQALQLNNWGGADNSNIVPVKRERYMNPATIEKRIRAEAQP